MWGVLLRELDAGLSTREEIIAYRLIITVNGVDSNARKEAYNTRWKLLVTAMVCDPPGLTDMDAPIMPTNTIMMRELNAEGTRNAG